MKQKKELKQGLKVVAIMLLSALALFGMFAQYVYMSDIEKYYAFFNYSNLSYVNKFLLITCEMFGLITFCSILLGVIYFSISELCSAVYMIATNITNSIHARKKAAIELKSLDNATIEDIEKCLCQKQHLSLRQIAIQYNVQRETVYVLSKKFNL